MNLYEQIDKILSAEYPVAPYGYVPQVATIMLRTGGIVEGRRLIEAILVVPYQHPEPEATLAAFTDLVYETLRPHLVELTASRMPDYVVANRERTTRPGHPAMLISGAGRNAGIGSGS
ncbi:hypothetical protein [Candidatus Poriferisocius sp.]|uniref:hypothetical protein n=1 Tax=Candidatus Poriferisocius sp. TaxID=3101276 RepID=UPI003B52DEA1